MKPNPYLLNPKRRISIVRIIEWLDISRYLKPTKRKRRKKSQSNWFPAKKKTNLY